MRYVPAANGQENSWVTAVRTDDQLMPLPPRIRAVRPGASTGRGGIIQCEINREAGQEVCFVWGRKSARPVGTRLSLGSSALMISYCASKFIIDRSRTRGFDHV